MASEGWTHRRFDQCAELIRETVHPSDVRGLHYIGLEHIAEGQLALSGHGSAEKVTSIKSRFRKGDILFGKLRPYFRKVVIAPFDGVCSTDIWVVRPRQGIDLRYLFYWMASYEFIEESTRASEGTRMPRAQWEFVGRIEKRVPALKEQQAISCILGTLDDKIETNRKMSQTLEAMARAIFKSWFVDFDPVRAKAAGQKPVGLALHIAELFPDSFEDSELGEIPKGWKVGVVGNIATQAIGGQWGSDSYEAGLAPSVCLRGCDMEDLRSLGYAPDAPIRFVKRKSIDSRLPSDTDVLIAASGAGPCGRPLWCSSSLNELFELPLIYSNFVKRLIAASAAHAVYLDRVLIQKFEDRTIHDFINGTSVPNLDAVGLLSGCPLLIPPDNVLDAFFSFCQPIYSRLYSKENVTLATLRDALLPKLICGDIPIRDAERIVGRCV